MSAHGYRATIVWERGEAVFTDGRYPRAHVWRFDGGVEVPGSSSPLAVRVPLSREDAVDPEEALVAALSSCHMLFVLDFARKAGFRVDRYADEAEGVMRPNARGKLYLAKATLRPAIAFSGAKRPSSAEVDALHHHAHEECFIANSVLTEIAIEGSFTFA
jgi:organic hydroperoxide reductase OsmC/OhrA